MHLGIYTYKFSIKILKATIALIDFLNKARNIGKGFESQFFNVVAHTINALLSNQTW